MKYSLTCLLAMAGSFASADSYGWYIPCYIPEPCGKPAPRPKSSSPEPPSAAKMRGPVIQESRALAGVASDKTAKSPTSRCRVGFWNVTGRDIQLQVEGKSQSLAKNRATTLELERHFLWQIDGGEMNPERVPDSQNYFEVIIR